MIDGRRTHCQFPPNGPMPPPTPSPSGTNVTTDDDPLPSSFRWERALSAGESLEDLGPHAHTGARANLTRTSQTSWGHRNVTIRPKSCASIGDNLS